MMFQTPSLTSIRFFLFALVLLLLLPGCRSDRKSNTEETTPAEMEPQQNVDIPFTGYWLSKSYYNQIIKDKSPRKAQEGSEDCFIYIPVKSHQLTSMIYNFHESGPELITIKTKDGYDLWEIQNDTLVQLAYRLTPESPNALSIGDKIFIRIHPDVDQSDTRILEEILFKGLYTSKEGKTIEFQNDGKISGLEKYKYYTPVIDYFDAGYQVDQIGLGENREQVEYFGFKFKKEKLFMYKLKCLAYDEAEQRCMDVTFGEQVFEWTKN